MREIRESEKPKKESLDSISEVYKFLKSFLGAWRKITVIQDGDTVVASMEGARKSVVIRYGPETDFQLCLTDDIYYDYRFYDGFAGLVAWIISGNLVKIAKWPLRIG